MQNIINNHFSIEALFSGELPTEKTLINNFFQNPPCKLKMTPAFDNFRKRVISSGQESVVNSGVRLKSVLVKRVNDNAVGFTDLQIAQAMGLESSCIKSLEKEPVNCRLLIGAIIFSLNNFADYRKRLIEKPLLSPGLNNVFGWVEEGGNIFHILLKPLTVSDGSIQVDYVKQCERYAQERVFTIHIS